MTELGVGLGLTYVPGQSPNHCPLLIFAENSKNFFDHKTELLILLGIWEQPTDQNPANIHRGWGVQNVFLLCVYLSTFCPQGSQKELLNLTQQDYVNRIEELNQSLKDAWASDQKVKALKIVIQVRLSDCGPPPPTPSTPLPNFLCKTPLWIIRVFRGLPSGSYPNFFTCSIFTYLWKSMIMNQCFLWDGWSQGHHVQLYRLCTVQFQEISPWITELLMSPQGCAVRWSCYSPWHIYDLYRLKIEQLCFDQIFFVSLGPMVACSWCMHFGVMFCIMMWHRQCVYSVWATFVESFLLIHDNFWITRASSVGKTAYPVSWIIRTSCLGKTSPEVHYTRNDVCIMIFTAEVTELLNSHFSSEVLALILVYCHGNVTFVFLPFFLEEG